MEIDPERALSAIIEPETPLVWRRGTARLLKMPCFLGKRPEDQPPKQKTREAISVLMNIGRGAAPLPRRNETVSPPDGIG